MNYLIEYPNVFSEEFCDDVIEVFEDYILDKSIHSDIQEFRTNKELDELPGKPQQIRILNIPKKTTTWNKIEKHIYKNVLIKVNEYKMQMLHLNNETIFNDLNKQLKVCNFTIQKYNTIIPENFNRDNSRKNVVTFILFLNNVDGGELIFTQNSKPDNVSSPITNQEQRGTSEFVVRPEIGKLIIFPDSIEHIFKINSYNGDYYVISNPISYI
jgi:hypothetical protein